MCEHHTAAPFRPVLVFGDVPQRETMALLDRAADAAGLGRWCWNLLDDTLVCDERFRRWYDLPEAQRGAPFRHDVWCDRVHPDDLDRAEALLARSLVDGDPLDHEFRIVGPGGAVRVIHAVAVVVRDSGGRALRMIGMDRDVTAEREADRALRSANGRLQSTRTELERQRDGQAALLEAHALQIAAARDAAASGNRAKRAFLAVVSHELRTPMNHIMGAADLLERYVADERAKPWVGVLRQSSRRLLGMIEDLLELSQVEAQTLQLCVVEFSLSRLLDRVERGVADMAAAKGIEVVSEIGPEVPPRLHGDVVRLQQILGNLVDNAVKFSDRGRIVVRVRGVGSPTGAASVRFEVVDQGVGIRPELQESLFRHFEQADMSLTRRHGGMGIGLALCRRLVALMAGDLGVTSAEGQGSTFWFQVPLRVAEASADAASAAALDRAQADRVVAELERLLGAEDLRARSLWDAEASRVAEPILGGRRHSFLRALEGFDFQSALVVLRDAVAASPDRSAGPSGPVEDYGAGSPTRR